MVTIAEYMYEFQKDDLIICKPPEEKRSPTSANHEVYSRVVDIDLENDKITLDRYLKQGRLRVRAGADKDGAVTINLSKLFEIPQHPIYQPMNNEDVLAFRDGLSELLSNYHNSVDFKLTEETLKIANETANGIEKGMIAMANWGNTATVEQENNTENLAYIHKDTRESAKDNPVIDELSNAVLEKAKEIMDKLSDAGLTTQSQTRDKSKTYTDKAVVKVEPAVKWNKETEQEEPLVHKDGSPVYKATAEIQSKGTKLTLIAKEDVSDGAKFVAMTASKWQREQGNKSGLQAFLSPSKLNFYKQDEIASAPINRDIKAIAAFIEEEGFITPKENVSRDSSLRNVAYEANQYFNANSEKVLNENNQLVNDAYAKYVNNDYGEKVELHNHKDNVVVELGETSNGDKYAVAVNYDLNADFQPRQQGEKPAKAFINKPADLEQFVDNPEIRAVVSEYKGFDEKQKEQPKDKPKKKDTHDIDR